jgi:tRNA 2-thiocytidine biosynthesis protein TtcA
MCDTLRKHDYNVLALAQHLDDLTESFLMSAFHGGRLNVMKAHYLIDTGDQRIIHPLIYVQKRQTRDFAKMSAFPEVQKNCPACF